MKRFIVAIDPLTAEDEKKFRDSLSGNGWWHWLPNFWLVMDPSDTLTSSGITSKIFEINGTKRAFVTEVNSTAWSALTKKDEQGNDMASWLHETWSK